MHGCTTLSRVSWTFASILDLKVRASPGSDVHSKLHGLGSTPIQNQVEVFIATLEKRRRRLVFDLRYCILRRNSLPWQTLNRRRGPPPSRTYKYNVGRFFVQYSPAYNSPSWIRLFKDFRYRCKNVINRNVLSMTLLVHRDHHREPAAEVDWFPFLGRPMNFHWNAKTTETLGRWTVESSRRGRAS